MPPINQSTVDFPFNSTDPPSSVRIWTQRRSTRRPPHRPAEAFHAMLCYFALKIQIFHHKKRRKTGKKISLVIEARGSPSEIFETVDVAFHVAGHLFGRFILAEIVDKSALRVDEVDDDGVVHDVVVVLVGLRRRTEVHPERLGGLGDLLRRSRQAKESGWKFYRRGGGVYEM